MSDGQGAPYTYFPTLSLHHSTFSRFQDTPRRPLRATSQSNTSTPRQLSKKKGTYSSATARRSTTWTTSGPRLRSTRCTRPSRVVDQTPFLSGAITSKNASASTSATLYSSPRSHFLRMARALRSARGLLSGLHCLCVSLGRKLRCVSWLYPLHWL
jgi:hypothetical protein